MKPKIINGSQELCGNCGYLVKYSKGTVTFGFGGAEYFDDTKIIKYNYFPMRGEK